MTRTDGFEYKLKMAKFFLWMKIFLGKKIANGLLISCYCTERIFYIEKGLKAIYRLHESIYPKQITRKKPIYYNIHRQQQQRE